MLRLQILLLFLNLYQCVFSQSDGSVRVRVMGGGNLDFIFNSIGDGVCCGSTKVIDVFHEKVLLDKNKFYIQDLKFKI